jgi:hypothetical protein
MPYKDPEIAKVKRKEYYLKNREKIIALNKVWFELNKDHAKAIKRKYRQSLSKEKRDEENLKARIRYYANKEKQSIRKKIYRSKNKHITNANAAKRRAAQLFRTPKWLTEFDLFKIQCMYKVAAMLTRVNNEPWVIDHIIPLQGKLVSGLHVPENLQFMRARDNESKQHKYEIT